MDARTGAALLVMLVATAAQGQPDLPDDVAAGLAELGVEGGLIVHAGCGSGMLLAALGAEEQYLVHGLATGAGNVQQARRAVRDAGLYGRVSVDQWGGRTLPYADNTVDLVIVDRSWPALEREIMRALAPEGVAYVRKSRGWETVVKPRPADIDEWTHSLHDPSNNAVSDDTVVGPPEHLQWVSGPKWGRTHDHLASLSVAVSSGGRIFSIVDEGPIATVALEPSWWLVAQDAFNGVLLWKREVPTWEYHLRGFRSGPSQLPRRLVAVGETVYATLGYGAPAEALDAATGETLRTYDGTEGAEELVLSGRTLYVVVGNPDQQRAVDAALRRGEALPHVEKSVIAFEADTGDVLWRRRQVDTAEYMPTTLCVGEGRVYYQSTREIVSLNAETGAQLWTADRPVATNRPGWSAPTLVLYEGVLLSADRSAEAQTEGDGRPKLVSWVPSSKGAQAPMGEVIAFSAETGERLWSAPCQETYNAPVDVLITRGLLWTGNLVRAKDPGITQALDPHTGEVKFTRPDDHEFFPPGMGHHRCHRNRATSRYLVLGRAGIEFIDTETGEGIPNHWVRGTCQYGVLPCNGLIYAPPHSCACFIQAKLNGFNALASTRATKPRIADGRLVRGPASGEVETEGPDDGDWPTYRHDPARTGRTESRVQAELRSAWRTELGGKLSSVVVSGGRLFVAQVDEHTVHALDAESGGKLWSYTVGGRVDSPPTIHEGMALFGSADGWVTCLRAADGKLVWRFRAAPEDRRIVAYGQLESVWPLHGSLLVQDGVAYAVAGRASYLDGGLTLCRLDAKTGKLLSERRIDSRDPETGQEPKGVVKGPNMPGGLPDVLSCDGESIYMRHLRFDLEGNELAQGSAHLFSPGGFLDDSWWHRTYWIVGTNMASGWGAWPRVGNRAPAGRLLAVDGDIVYGFGRSQYHRGGAHVGLDATTYRLFGTDATVPPATPPEKQRRNPDLRLRKYQWTADVEVLARALVLADGKLLLAGPPDLPDKDTDGLAALDGREGGVLWVADTDGGAKLGQVELRSPPVLDGMAVVDGAVYMATLNGAVECLTEG